MPTSKDVPERLIAKFGSTIDLRAKPQVLQEIIAELKGVNPVASDHYKGDTFTKEYPNDGTYEKNYIRGYAIVAGLKDEARILDEVQLAVDQALLAALRK